MDIDTEPRTHSEYTVGWICALPKEQTAATAMLDREHKRLPKPPNDPNTYTLGSIGEHNVVIACLPKGQYGTNPAATVAAWMVSTFPTIKFGLMVGIGGGIPPKVRLGDVVVSTPVGQFPGVVQWDIGKANEGGNFERTGSLNNPPTSLLTALTTLETRHALGRSNIPQYLAELKTKFPGIVSKYLPSGLQDILFKANYGHVNKGPIDTNNNKSTAADENDDEREDEDDEDEEEEEWNEDESCKLCDRTEVVKRKARDMTVHFGLIASGNQVIKDAALRNKLKKDFDGHVLCVEMEAAGLMNNFPCIVIRGICDYADSHKNKDWQEYAAVRASAFAKEFLSFVQASEVAHDRPVNEILGHVIREIETNVNKLRTHIENEEDLKIIEWITPIDFGPQQSDFLARRQPGTGQWLLDSTKFQTWKATRSQTIFCPGMPGAGKTIISSIVINNLDHAFQSDPTIGIAYIYCNFRQQGDQKINDLLASLLKQLTRKCQHFPDSVQALYKRHRSGATRPSTLELSNALQTIAGTFSRIFIIVDALDECQTSSRLQFLPELFHLQARCGANIMATSRVTPEITAQFKDSFLLEIRATDEDVRMYLDGHMSQLRPFVRDNSQLKEEIKNAISEAVDGMFLLAQIYLSFLEDKLTTNDIRTSLATLQKQDRTSSEEQKTEILGHAYDRIMERIEQQQSGLKKLALKVLSWITCATRPLSTYGLRDAVAIQHGASRFDDGDMPDVEDMVSVCLGLVTIDEQSNIVRLVHYTTQEYFARARENWLLNAHTEITISCVTCLSFEIFEIGPNLIRTMNEGYVGFIFHGVYVYAASNWGYHAKYSGIENSQLILDFLHCPSKTFACDQAVKDRGPWNRKVPASESQIMTTGLHLAAHFGLERLAMKMLDENVFVDSPDHDGQTTLSRAAQNGHDGVVKLLLQRRAFVNAKDKYNRTPLSLAARNGHDMVLKLLLETNACGID
ncbi:hypothetical protein N7528_005517 [Penicillium herquei]|nr:hypothetical protein N7528_005517 [Penicillium herquei]